MDYITKNYNILLDRKVKSVVKMSEGQGEKSIKSSTLPLIGEILQLAKGEGVDPQTRNTPVYS